MIQEIIGIVGVMFIALSWIPQVVQAIKTKKSGINPKFGVAQFIGSALILIYSYMINQPLFIVLNIIAIILISLNLRYVFRGRRK